MTEMRGALASIKRFLRALFRPVRRAPDPEPSAELRFEHERRRGMRGDAAS
ncbi:MAG: hypothetical protein QNJ12_11730 [Ilumatobacter sp.]|uniref:hypothetical protein n=1 Tax=Ilumatobacter sp. TaxID=1967498 RepID=UPI00260B7E93|nr:hypothetical protein [Ilumatobacter sp.]MDJ0769460.1 hypothetical protein [Ilumatobacter sp.]